MLTEQQISQFHQSGYCTVEGFASLAKIQEVKQAAANIIDRFDAEDTTHIFATGRDTEIADDYFLDSADDIRCFLEETAVTPDGNLTCDKQSAVNKIGHALHDRHPVFDAFSRDPRLATIASDLDISQPRIMQSMYIQKSAHVGGEVGWHQDATFFYTDPLSVVTFWFALDSATLENGCLWVQNDARGAPLRTVFEVEARKATTRTLDSTPWPTTDSATPVEVEAGTLVLFCGTLPHYSAPNTSAQPRHAYTLHVVDAAARYSPKNWIQRPDARGF